MQTHLLPWEQQQLCDENHLWLQHLQETIYQNLETLIQ